MSEAHPRAMSEEELAQAKSWAAHKDDMAVGPDFRTGMVIASKLLSHIASLSTRTSGMTEEGDIWICKCGWRSTWIDEKCVSCGRDRPKIYEAIIEVATSQLSQGNGAEEMREAAAKVCDNEALLWGKPDSDPLCAPQHRAGCSRMLARSIRALPIPPAATEVTEDEKQAAYKAYGETMMRSLRGEKLSIEQILDEALLAARKARG